jgi:hypothetical protein
VLSLTPLANLGMAVGRPIVGYFSDSIGRVNVAWCNFSVRDLLLLHMDVYIHYGPVAGVRCLRWDCMWHLLGGALSISLVGSARRTN